MPSLNLKSDGPVAKYLGFIVGEPTYKPSNFCTLFWMLLLSPLVFAFYCFINALQFLQKKLDTAIDISFKRQAAQLALRYEKYPNEAIIDYYQHFGNGRYNISNRRKVRDYRTVIAAFHILEKKFETLSTFDVLRSISTATEITQSSIESIYFQLVNSKSDNTEIKNVWNFWHLPLGILLAFTFVFLPVIISLPEGVVIFCITWISTLTGCLFYRLELNIVVYNVYQAIKDKTCPLIVWD